jgi:hypothetical protein
LLVGFNLAQKGSPDLFKQVNALVDAIFLGKGMNFLSGLLELIGLTVQVQVLRINCQRIEVVVKVGYLLFRPFLGRE